MYEPTLLLKLWICGAWLLILVLVAWSISQ